MIKGSKYRVITLEISHEMENEIDIYLDVSYISTIFSTIVDNYENKSNRSVEN